MNAPGTFDAVGWRWRADSDVATLDGLLDAETIAALHGAPDRTSVELRDGALCVAARGVHHDPASLDGLCRLASGLARGLERLADARDSIPPGTPLPRAALLASAGPAPRNR